MDINQIINELGEDRDLYFRAVAPPIIQTSNFTFTTVEALRTSFENEYSDYLYSRGKNPTVSMLCKKLAALDGAEDCLVFNSGAAATFAAVLANVQQGSHIISVNQPYTWAQKMFDSILPKFGVTITYVDGTTVDNFINAAAANTEVIYLESPNSWTYELQDLKAIAAFAQSKKILTIIDNSYCTPIYQQPISLGIDITIQSATKYIGGHSDVVAGVLCASSKIIERIFNSEYLNIGSGIQPFNAWLLLRGLRTLPIRLAKISETTKVVLAFLNNHPQVEHTYFPLQEGSPQLPLAQQQMKGACGLITFVLKANKVEQIEAFCNALQHILMAVSWGGYESLIIPKCAGMPKESFDAKNREHRMLRLYVGLEEPTYIINDLLLGFAAM